MRSLSDDAAVAFVLERTLPSQAPLVPEIRLHLAHELLPIWHATRAEEPPFWAFAWPGSQVLARWVLDHPEEVRGRRVLDFASGCGLAAIAAAQAGAASVVACDVDPLAQAAQQLNAELNAASIQTRCEDVIDRDVDADVILAGDVCYARQLSARVTAWLGRLATSGRSVLLADPMRAYGPSSQVELLATFEVPTTRELESGDSRTTRLLRFRAAGRAARWSGRS